MIFLLQLADVKDCICCASAWDKPKLWFVNSQHLSNEAVGNLLNDFHSLFRQFQSSIVASVESITLSLKGRRWSSAPSQVGPSHLEWLIWQGRGSWKHLYHLLLWSSTPLPLMGQQLCRTSSWRWPSLPINDWDWWSFKWWLSERYSGSHSNSTLRSLS